MDAILECWYLGTMSGKAVADVISGDYNPSGHLTMSFPRTVGQIPIYYNHKNTGRPLPENKDIAGYTSSYTDIVNRLLYPFGYGLSYTKFELTNLTLDESTLSDGTKINVTVDVANLGDYDGITVVQLYIRDLVGSLTRPVKELKGFQKINLKQGETRKLQFEITEKMLEFYDLDLKKITEAGKFKLWVGFNAEDNRYTAEFTLK